VVLLCSVIGLAAVAEPYETIKLSPLCPASFVKQDDGKCKFEHAYQQYKPPARFANLHDPLPPARDGFTAEQISLGKLLFFDPLLSGDATVSCAHCHHPDLAFADGRGQSMGRAGKGIGPKRVGGILLERSSPSLWNIGFLDRLFLDNRAASLEEQAEGPLYSPLEMANTPEQLAASLNNNDSYRRLFSEAFGLAPDDPLTAQMAITALVAFQGSLISLNSPFDQFLFGDESALSKDAKWGYELFNSFATRCANCHIPPMFTDGLLSSIGAPEPEGKNFDPGAGGLEGDISLNGAFRNSPLRNVALTAPYMHSGGEPDLREAVKFYNEEPGHDLPKGERVLVHWMIFRGPKWTEYDVDALVAFLEALSDESLMPTIPTVVPSGLPVVQRLR